jgi:ribosome-associated toxin RatA of RatAB toxin-antitoxin module
MSKVTAVKRLLAASVVLAATLMAAVPSSASGSGPWWKRLKSQQPKAERYLEQTRYSKIRAGGARVYVPVSVETTRATVTDFDHYDDMISRFEEARIVGKRGDQTDVFLKLPILGGKSHLSAVVRFDAPRKVADDEYIITGDMISGNFREFRVTYHLTQVDNEGTVLDLKLLMDPKVPRVLAPKGYLEEEAASASDGAVRRLRDHSRRRAARG